ncbi:hypothetical protein G4224_07100 [Aeromonas jandaei]|nr:hypothetical protein [Aeromonas jandaei]
MERERGGRRQDGVEYSSSRWTRQRVALRRARHPFEVVASLRPWKCCAIAKAGPQFTPVPSPEQVKVIAHFQNHQIAALISSYGKGKVAVSGPHPEAPESWKENAVDGDKMESNIHLAVGLVNELLSEEPVTHSK